MFLTVKNAALTKLKTPRNPINMYGQSKAEAESKLLDIVPDCCIVRTSCCFGIAESVSRTLFEAGITQPELRVVDDQRGCPTYTFDLAAAISGLVRKQADGIVHVTTVEVVRGLNLRERFLPQEAPNQSDPGFHRGIPSSGEAPGLFRSLRAQSAGIWN